MTWNQLHPDHRLLAENTLTRKQLDVYKLHLAGCGTRRIALMLDISQSTARTHLARAHQKLAIALDRRTAA